MSYIDPTGKGVDCRTVRNRVVNESATPIELTIKFPADSFPILPSPDSYVKLFLLSDTLTLGKEGHDYDVTDLESFLESFDIGLNNNNKVTTMLQRTINPKEEYFFHIGVIFYQSGGIVRAGLVLKEQDLFIGLA